MTELGLGSDAPRDVVESKHIREGHVGLFATHFIAEGDVAITVRGTILSEPTRYSVQVGDGRHANSDGLIENTNHSCTPSAFLDLSDAAAPRLRALRDIALGGEITFNYCASEEDMSSPFDCQCGAGRCYREIKGFRYLTAEQRVDLGELASPWLVAKYTEAQPTPDIGPSEATETRAEARTARAS